MTTERPYRVIDVFTQTPLAGNPLAVIFDSSGLDTDRMQAIAREFSLSETVFILPPRDPAHRARVRIFTPAYELPFAGHPIIGTAICLALQDGGSATPRPMILEAGVGPIHCDVHAENGCGHARFSMPRLPQPVQLPGSTAHIAAALMLHENDILTAPYHLAAYGAGNAGFAFVPLRNLAALAGARQVPQHWQAAFGSLIGAYIYTPDTGDDALQFRSRMLDLATGEDPATGSAAAAFAAVIAATRTLADGPHIFTIGQGYEMQRPSQIELTLHMQDGKLHAGTIAGHGVVVMSGTLLRSV